LHPFATDNAALRWDFFVRHFADREQQQRDPRFVDARDGVLYPRAGALGGCTSTNAMILMYPTNRDWDEIAVLTGDESWRASNMRRYANRLQDSPETGFGRWIDRVMRRAPQSRGWLSAEQPTLNWAPEEKVLVNAIRRVLLPRTPYQEWFTVTPYRDWFKRYVVGREEISGPTAAQNTLVDVHP
jgi:choline dehydrogenase